MPEMQSNETLVSLIQQGINKTENLLTLYNQNRKLILKIIRKYITQAEYIEDAMQDAYFSVVQAAEKFSPNFGVRFTTYLEWCVLGTVVKQYQYQSESIRIPYELRNIYSKAKKANDVLSNMLGRIPTDEEIAAEIGVPIEKVIKANLVNQPIVSFEQELKECDGTTLGDLLADSESEEQFEKIYEDAAAKVLWDAVNLLDPHMRYTIKLRYCNELTLDKIAEIQGATREQVRVCIEKAIQILRKNRNILSLKK